MHNYRTNLGSLQQPSKLPRRVAATRGMVRLDRRLHILVRCDGLERRIPYVDSAQKLAAGKCSRSNKDCWLLDSRYYRSNIAAFGAFMCSIEVLVDWHLC